MLSTHEHLVVSRCSNFQRCPGASLIEMVSSNVKVEVAFESPAVFAGDELTALISFRNTGVAAPAVNAKSISESSWSRRISMQISNTIREFVSPESPLDTVTETPADTTRTPAPTESLIMGFVQLQGYFLLDNTLVDVSQFLHTKNSGVLVGAHGLDYSSGNSESSGILHAMTSGIESLLGDDKANTKALSGGLSRSKSIRKNGSSFSNAGYYDSPFPLFSTPQSLLFTDIKLQPNEIVTFKYRYKLPETLPPSCRSKSIQIHYNLTVGAQRIVQDPLSNLMVPRNKNSTFSFRVFPYVSPYGQQYKHDLKRPLVLQQDTAIITQLKNRKSAGGHFGDTKGVTQPESSDSVQQFKAYVKELLEDSNSMTGKERVGKHLSVSEEAGAKDNIDFYITYHPTQSREFEVSANNADPCNGDTASRLFSPPAHQSNFDIGRGNSKVASVSFSKPAFRIGEEVVLQLDFSTGNRACYHVTVALETCERIDSSVSTKSPQETQLATRRTYSQLTLSTFSLSLAHFDLTIPSTVTPQFTTSEISLQWQIRLDFITSTDTFITELEADERGKLYSAPESLSPDIISCYIPLTVIPTNKDFNALYDNGVYVRRSSI